MSQSSTLSLGARAEKSPSSEPRSEAFVTPDAARLTHLKQLEAESIHIIREVALSSLTR